jgi:Zn-dependent M28 family amino/carboxypeptidase
MTMTWRILLLVVVSLLLCVAALFGVRRHPVAPHPAAPAPAPVDVTAILRQVDLQRLQAHMTHLATTIGVRREGTAAERAAVDYVQAQFTAYGLATERETVTLPNDTTSQNVLARLPGRSDRVVLIGAHLDSKAPSPGANDNASGVAAVLEIARVMKAAGATPPDTLLFVGFGAEEMIDRHRDHHHYGSRHLARTRPRPAAMISLDMVGVGTRLHIDSYGPSPTTLRDALARAARTEGVTPVVGKSKPLSDHEAFADAQTPVSYLHWERDTAYHTRRDTAIRVQPKLMAAAARCVIRALLDD